MISDTWEGSFETDVSSKRPIDAQIQKTLTFIQKHEEQLQKNDDGGSLFSDAKTSSFRAVRIALDPTERVSVQNILHQDDTNESLRKMLVVLVFLCDEIHELKEIAEEKFFAPLIMFGRSPVEDSKGKEKK